MSASGGPAYEERAELALLRDQADQSAAAAARTLAELNRRLSRLARARAAARTLTARARATAGRTVGAGTGRPAARPAARRAALAVLPLLIAAGVLGYAAAQGKIRFRYPERVRGFTRPVRSR